MRAYLNAMRGYATFTGRTSRAEFLQAHIVLLPLILIALWVLGASVIGRSIWPALVFWLIFLPHIVPWAALVVRRLHDKDRAGWWALVTLVPLVILPPLVIFAVLGWGIPRGTPGSNRFGAPTTGAHPVSVDSGVSIPQPELMEARDVVGEIERLARLKASGALTDEEFEAMKAKALGPGKTA